MTEVNDEVLKYMKLYAKALAYIAELEAQIERITNVQSRAESKSS